MVSAINGIYVTPFRWWLEPLLTSQAERDLKRDVKRDLGFLFVRFAAHFVPNERTYRWGKVVTLAAGDVKIQISLDRGDYYVALSPNIEPSEWAGVRDLLTAVLPTFVCSPCDPLSLAEWAKLLEPHFGSVEQAYCPEHYPVTKSSLERLNADSVVEMKREVASALAERARETRLIAEVLSEFDGRFEAAQAERINALFEVFSEYRWNKDREHKLRSGLNEVLRPELGQTKAIEVMNRLMKVRETS
jgi:hypothetical protein